MPSQDPTHQPIEVRLDDDGNPGHLDPQPDLLLIQVHHVGLVGDCGVSDRVQSADKRFRDGADQSAPVPFNDGLPDALPALTCVRIALVDACDLDIVRQVDGPMLRRFLSMSAPVYLDICTYRPANFHRSSE
ncbi:hypothetical protein CMEL01_13044 [Colletotrichum melonis]|uniref:Uncharacterized protein n=2 Tax=Colletotrichum acutatum species complex TaxID=2707335 RepID=A0AAI9UYA8_9PEZI|nr:hypothetical protein CLIM01_07501 [Colletotrichum limetticola]KAK1464283.1 hypothetical protein CMEL01_13044 [Colletotrichum melonis]